MVIYNCKYCNYETKQLAHYNKHIISKKHLLNINNKNKSIYNNLKCNICNKIYSSNGNLNRHLKKCQLLNNQNKLMELQLENQKLNYEMKIKDTETNCKDKIIDVLQNSNNNTNINNTNNTINNTQNNTINLNFLNQNYGNVITMDDFKKLMDEYKIPSDIVEMIESAFNFNTLSAKSQSLIGCMKDVCKKNDIDMLPFICNDSNIRSHKEKTKDGWKVVINNDNIVYLIDSTFRSIAIQYPDKVIIAPPQERLEDLPKSIKKSLSSIKDIQIKIDNQDNKDDKMEKLKYYMEKLLNLLKQKNDIILKSIISTVYIDNFINVRSLYKTKEDDILTNEEFKEILRYLPLKDIDNITINKLAELVNYH